MKIDNDKPGVLTGAPEPLNRTPPHPLPATRLGATTADGDHLKLSPEARLLRAATETAASTPPIRADVVERMRDLLANDGLGTDARRLADAIIDNWLEAQ